jgi:hypothetical protein
MGSKHLLTPFISYNNFFIRFGALRVMKYPICSLGGPLSEDEGLDIILTSKFILK